MCMCSHLQIKLKITEYRKWNSLSLKCCCLTKMTVLLHLSLSMFSKFISNHQDRRAKITKLKIKKWSKTESPSKNTVNSDSFGIFKVLNHLSFLVELIDKLDFQDKCVSHDSTSNCVSAPAPQMILLFLE